ncbi:cell cycle control protein 50B isoform X2 [Rhincodon typus]|uniref:cell cycle control protein 50B isoform X2 n=1 Tax=Rhincodon typus TaxID=259920 RepID=UPI00202ECC8D|nr:cell cycle control protein 50B isoform X2 [Rhincodon typus]
MSRQQDRAVSKNKPDGTAFTQQRLPAWQPFLSAGYVLPTFFLLGLVFIAIGLGLYFTSNNVIEIELEYTGKSPNSSCHHCTKNGTKDCKCTIEFKVDKMLPGPVFMYYELVNFYQNHRKYGVSRDDDQLNGDLKYLKEPSEYCFPFRWDGQDRPIAPCGAIANSMFNGTVKPNNWPRPAYELDTNPENNGFINEDFIVWMRTAALPTFRKLYRRIDDGLQPGNYLVEIHYHYPVLSFNGQKRVTFSTISWMGGRNPFLGIAYLVCGSACIITGIIMFIVYIKYQGQNIRKVE